MEISLGRISTGPLSATTTATAGPVAGSVLDLSQSESGNGSYVVTETGGVNGATIAVDASNDGVNWALSVISTNLNAGASAVIGFNVGSQGRYVRLSVVDASSGNHATVVATGYAQ